MKDLFKFRHCAECGKVFASISQKVCAECRHKAALKSLKDIDKRREENAAD